MYSDYYEALDAIEDLRMEAESIRRGEHRGADGVARRGNRQKRKDEAIAEE